MRKVYFVAGLAWGDEGKGTIVDALVAKTQAPLVVRYNGGAQAAHHVVAESGQSHCFAQFGSGTLHGAMTFLSRFVTLGGRLPPDRVLEQRGRPMTLVASVPLSWSH